MPVYTNIDTDGCLERLATFLRSTTCKAQFTGIKTEALTEALALVTKKNRMRFDNIIVLQLIGIALGMSPDPTTIANLYVAIFEAQKVLPWLKVCLLYLCRFIDDGFGIWIHHPDPATDLLLWDSFQRTVNEGRHTWEFIKRSRSVDFMDVTISIDGSKLETNLFEKKLALHLYLPPHSCHPPGVLRGLIFGQVLRIYSLRSREADIDSQFLALLRTPPQQRLPSLQHSRVFFKQSTTRQPTSRPPKPTATWSANGERKLREGESFCTYHSTPLTLPPRTSSASGEQLSQGPSLGSLSTGLLRGMETLRRFENILIGQATYGELNHFTMNY
ncbi:hypothetical protein ACHAWF_010445 [Thalassiosira exigua]